MDREGIRRLAAEELGLARPLPYRFADAKDEFLAACAGCGFSVRGQAGDVFFGQGAKRGPQTQPRPKPPGTTPRPQAGPGPGRVIVEGFVEFDYEITLLTVRHVGGTSFLHAHRPPAGERGLPRILAAPSHERGKALAEAQRMAQTITAALGGRGIFGVELFVKGDQVLFSEVSPRPHDTGMVTLISQDLSEFALHVRAILGLPIPEIRQYGPAASRVILAEGDSDVAPSYEIAPEALAQPDTAIRLFGKPEMHGLRRMGVALALGRDVDDARRKAIATASHVRVKL